jgi:hypothetical protein
MTATRRSFESIMGDYAKTWRAGQPVAAADGSHTLDYFINPKKNVQPDELVSLVRTAGGANVLVAEIR